MSKPTSIFRIKKRTCPFVQINNAIFEDARMSWRAKGLLGYLLSRPDDWMIVLGDLEKRSTDAKHAIKGAMKELELLGYARRKKRRGEDGKMAGENWFVFEKPIPDEVGMDNEGNLLLSLTGDRSDRRPENPPPVKPAAGASSPSNTDLNSNTKGGDDDSIREFIKLNAHSISAEFVQLFWKWVARRRSKRKGYKPDVAHDQLLFLQSLPLDTALDALANSLRNDWQGLFDPRSSKQKRAFDNAQYSDKPFGGTEP